jgi:hypothetical protein
MKITLKPKKRRLGKCFQLAGRYIFDHPDVILIHGTINGSHLCNVPDFDNPHAWIEGGDEVYDLVLDQRLPKDVYYQIMHAKIKKRYTQNEMNKLVLRTGHWGPWE